MNCVIDRQLDDQFAKAWYNLGGDFSYMFSKKVLSFCKKNNFAPKNVLEALKKAGFKNVEICDFNLNPATNPELRNKIHIVATK